MQKKRALVTTALLSTALSLLGCTASTGSAVSGLQLPSYQQSLVTQANRQAALASAPLPDNSQIAQAGSFGALQIGTRTDVPSGILQPGSIILRRSSVVEKPIPAEELAATMRRIATEAASQQFETEKPIILAAAEDRIDFTASRLTRQSEESLRQAEVRMQAGAALQAQQVAEAVKAYAEQNTAATADELRAYAKSIEQKTTALEQGLTDAERRQKDFVVGELAFREQTTNQKFDHLTERQEILAAAAREYARAEALSAQLAAQNTTIQQAQEVSRMAQSTAQLAESRSRDYAADKIALASAETKLATQQLSADVTAKLATASAEAKLTAKQTEAQLAATTAEGKLAQQQLAASLTAQLAATSAEAKLAAQQTEAKLAAATAENKLAQQQLSASLANQLAATSAETKSAAQQAEARLAAAAAENKLAQQQLAAALSSQMAAASASNQLATQQLSADVTGKLAAVEAQNQLSAQQTASELHNIREAQARQQEVFQNTLTQVASELKTYGDNQIQSLAHETRSSISQTAAVAQQTTAELTAQTADRLAQMRAEAANRSELLATRLTNRFAEELNTLATETEAKRLTPEQIANAASQAADSAVTNATPQFRALALQTLADSQDYIRTVAQESLTDGSDPAVQEALQQAAKTVITKDDQVVFAIRDALTPRAASPALTEEERTMLGDGARPDSITADTMLQAGRLGIAPIAGNKGSISPASGPGHLASLNPAQASIGSPRHRQDWIDLRKYRVVVHEDGTTLENLMSRIMAEAVPYTGPWQIKWKLRPENIDLTGEVFSLDAETTFEEFVTYVSQYVHNARGVKLSFNLFDAEHILVISD